MSVPSRIFQCFVVGTLPAACVATLILSGCGGSAWWATAFYAGACLFGGFFTVREAVENLREGRFEIDTLMLAAAMGAISLGKWFEAALLLFLFSIGHALEHYAMGCAKRTIEMPRGRTRPIRM